MPFTDIAGSDPTVGVFDCARFGVVLPIAFEDVWVMHQNLTIVGELDPPAFRRLANVARTRKRTGLSADDATGLFCLAVNFDDVDAVHLPECGRVSRHRRAAADHEFELIETDFVED